MSGQHSQSSQSSGSSGHSSMDHRHLHELERLQPTSLDVGDVGVMDDYDVDRRHHQITMTQLAAMTELPIRKLPQMNTDNWIHMSSLHGIPLTDSGGKETLSPWSGYRGVGSDSGLGHEDSTGVCTRTSNNRIRQPGESSLPRPPSYWKFAVLLTVINPPLGVLALLLCYLTHKDAQRGHLLQAKRRSKYTLITIVLAFALSVLAVVLFVVVLTARNEYPFRMEPTITERRRLPTTSHGLNINYVPPPPVNLGRKKVLKRPKPPPFIPRPKKPVHDVLGDLMRKWKGVNATSFDFTQHDEFIKHQLGNTTSKTH